MAAPAIGVRPRFAPRSAAIDWSHPLAQRMVFCALGVDGVDMVTGALPSVLPQAVTMSPFGWSSKFTHTNAASAALSFTSGPWSILVVGHTTGDPTDVLNRSTYVSESNNNGTQMFWRPNVAGTSGWGYLTGRNNDFANWLCGGSTLPGTRGGFVVLAASNGVGTRSLYVDGKVATKSTNVNPLTSSADLVVGGANATVALAAAWSRELNVNEVATLNATPFCMLRY